jgi:retron-type reverse transcriptase
MLLLTRGFTPRNRCWSSDRNFERLIIIEVKHTYKLHTEGQLSEEVRVTSGVPQGSVLGPLLFLDYVNDIGRNIESFIRLFADDCVIYRKILNNENMEKLQKYVDKMGEWAVVNSMKINPRKVRQFVSRELG